MIFISVDLPAPFSPSTAWISPGIDREVDAVVGDDRGVGLGDAAHPPQVVVANGMVSVTNLIVRERFGDGPTIALNAHGDVVPPGLGWTADPYGAEIWDGCLYGRGAAVSKSDFATYAYALLALKASGAARSGTVELHFTYDEEAGGEVGPKLDPRARPCAAGLCDFRGFFLRDHHGAQRLPAPRGRDHRTIGARGARTRGSMRSRGRDRGVVRVSMQSARVTARRNRESTASGARR